MDFQETSFLAATGTSSNKNPFPHSPTNDHYNGEFEEEEEEAKKQNAVFTRQSVEVGLRAVPTSAMASSSSSQLHPTSSTSSSSPRIIVGSSNEGVFSNMAAKPSVIVGKTYEDPLPPSYDDLDLMGSPQQQVPPYFETTVMTQYGEDGDILIEGLPVGNMFIFVVNAVVSMSFDFIGFLLTTLLASSHAAKSGSKFGLGITLLRYGLFIKTRDVTEELDQARYFDPNSPETMEHLKKQNEWMSYLLMVVGFFMIMFSSAEYFRATRLRKAILTTAEASGATV